MCAVRNTVQYVIIQCELAVSIPVWSQTEGMEERRWKEHSFSFFNTFQILPGHLHGTSSSSSSSFVSIISSQPMRTFQMWTWCPWHIGSGLAQGQKVRPTALNAIEYWRILAVFNFTILLHTVSPCLLNFIDLYWEDLERMQMQTWLCMWEMYIWKTSSPPNNANAHSQCHVSL